MPSLSLRNVKQYSSGLERIRRQKMIRTPMFTASC